MYGSVWIVVFSYFLKHGSASGRSRCFDCTGLASPRDCSQLTECEVGESCFLMQYVTESAHVKYDVGCLANDRCMSLSSDLGRRSGSVTTCMECCDGEFCNIEGCGVNLLPKEDRGPLCFNCKSMADPHLCRTVTLCPQGEGCNIHSSIHESSTVVYSSGCIGLACDSLNNATLNLHKNCPLCCTGDYCNDHCRHG